MKKILLKESEFTMLIESVTRNIINEINSREQIYLDQIKKQFPNEIDNWDGKTPIDEFYLELVNKKKEQDKLQRRMDRKKLTAQRNAEYKSKFGERDKEIKKHRNEQKIRELIDHFVDFLPKNFPNLINKDDIENSFYLLIGEKIGAFSEYYEENSEKITNLLSNSINSDKYEDYFFTKIEEKYGKHTIEW